MKLSPNALGSLYMTLGSLGYVVNDAFVRRITDEGPGVYQVLCIRSIGLALIFAGAGKLRGETLNRSHLRRPLLLRVAAETVSSALFFAGLVQLDFANAQAILQVVPFAVMLAAALVLNERVQPMQYVAILLGFVGVLIVVRPATSGFSAWSLVVLASALFMVVREFATRKVQADTPALAIAFLTAVSLGVLTGIVSVFDQAWQGFGTSSWLFFFISISSLVAGYLFSIETVRVGDLSVSAPFRYTLLVGAVVIGYLLFDEVPDRYTVIGSVLIVATGLYAVRLETLNRRSVGRRI